MTVKILNQYVRPDGGVTVSVDDLAFERPKTMYRLIADEGMGLSYGETEGVIVVDVEDPTGWVEAPLPPPIEQDVEPEEIAPSPEEIAPSPLIGNDAVVAPETTHTLSPTDYLEWVDYKSRLSALEYELSMLLNVMKATQTAQDEI